MLGWVLLILVCLKKQSLIFFKKIRISFQVFFFISSLTKIIGYVGGNAWNYYHILGNTRESYVVGLDLTSSRKECELYVNGGSYPTLTEFGYFDTSNPGRIVIPDPIGETWFIGIYGRKSPCTYNLRVCFFLFFFYHFFFEKYF